MIWIKSRTGQETLKQVELTKITFAMKMYFNPSHQIINYIVIYKSPPKNNCEI